MNRRDFLRTTSGHAGALMMGEPVWGAPGTQPSPVMEFMSDPGPLAEFVLDNLFDHPFYFWPNTLLTYRIKDKKGIDLQTCSLSCLETGTEAPFQISRPTDDEDTEPSLIHLSFVADLPAGVTRTYQLRQAQGGGKKSTHRATATADRDSIVLNSGTVQIRIPATQQVNGTAPGPIMQMRQDGVWVGRSRISFAKHQVVSITTLNIYAGEVFQTYEIAYELAGGGRYVATVECAAGLDFIRLREEMHSLPDDANGTFEFDWGACSFTHRNMPDHPYPFPDKIDAGHRYEDYAWERMNQEQINTHVGVLAGINEQGELAYSVGVFQPWPVWTTGSYISFWNDKTNDASAIFVDRTERWVDPDYPVWHSSSRLRVRFVYKAGELTWVWPLVKGARSTGISFYNHDKDREQMSWVEKCHRGIRWRDGAAYDTALFPASYGLFLQNRFGTLDLDRVKDWVLTAERHSASRKLLFDIKERRSAAELEHAVISSNLTSQIVLSGTRQNNGYGPTSSRTILDGWISDYEQLASSMTEKQRKRIDAFYLLQAYVHAGEDYMPMIAMLSGHPNFLSDVKSTPAGIAYLYPEHPLAATWMEEYEKFVALNTHFHTRPAVRTWGSQGGRWTENIGTYVWAFLKPTLRANFLLKQLDGYDRALSPQMAEIGDWLVNALSAPFAGETKEFLANADLLHDAHLWGTVIPADGPRRVHPPMGAHAERRKPPRILWYLGTMLQQYAPLTAEHLMWACYPADQDQELRPSAPDVWKVMYRQPDNRGTNPHLRSSKYTGYGITLRAAVGTGRELSIHLQQIDDGPNYRWGVPAEGGCGVLYFYANGKGYSHNGKEDEGDRFDQDTDFGTNFGVWKDGRFRAVGQNVLSRPLIDLETAQFAELTPRQGERAYCTPEYVSRSILLAGADYFILYDRVFNESVGHRLSWFVRKGEDFPHMTMLRGLNKDALHTSSIETEETVGRWYDGTGDSMLCVTHRDGIVASPASFGAKVKTPESEDLVFYQHESFHYVEAGLSFEGTRGLIRQCEQSTELVLVDGSAIGAEDVTLRCPEGSMAVAATIRPRGGVSGKVVAFVDGYLELSTEGRRTHHTFYLNGSKVESAKPGLVRIAILEGAHRWELTAGLPVPQSPVVMRTECFAGGAIAYSSKVSGATGYRLELSDDNGATWKQASVSSSTKATVSGLLNGKKYHIRFVALNNEQESAAGDEYPLYVTQDAPAPPAGLTAKLMQGKASLTWGEVLGVIEYRLYKRARGGGSFTLVYHGLERNFVDEDSSIRKADAAPLTTARSDAKSVIEYAVAAVNGNGEGAKSRFAHTDPASWRSWDPIGKEPFRRPSVVGHYGEPMNDQTGAYYPTQYSLDRTLQEKR